MPVMMFQPDCPCCDDCILYASTWQSLTDWNFDWDYLIGDDSNVVSVSGGELELNTSVLAETVTAHPDTAGPHSMSVDVDVYADAANTKIVLAAPWRSDFGQGLFAEIAFGDSPNCGTVRLGKAYTSGYGPFTLTFVPMQGQYNFSWLTSGVWYHVRLCWDGTAKTLTVTVSNGTRSESRTWHEPTGFMADFIESGAGTYRAAIGVTGGTATFKALSLAAVKSTETGRSCPSCSPSCAMLAFNGSLDCEITTGGTWSVITGGYQGAGYLMHNSEILEEHFQAVASFLPVGTDWANGISGDMAIDLDFNAPGVPAHKAVCTVEQQTVDAVHQWRIKCVLAAGAPVYSVWSNGCPTQVWITVCRHPTELIARFLAKMPLGYSDLQVDVVAAVTTAVEVHYQGIEIASHSGICTGFVVTKHAAQLPNCPTCQTCSLCDEEHLPPDLVRLDFGASGFLTGTSCAYPSTIGGVYSLAAIADTGGCAWAYVDANVCDYPPHTGACPTKVDWSVAVQLISGKFWTGSAWIGDDDKLWWFVSLSIGKTAGPTCTPTVTAGLTAYYLSAQFLPTQCDAGPWTLTKLTYPAFAELVAWYATGAYPTTIELSV